MWKQKPTSNRTHTRIIAKDYGWKNDLFLIPLEKVPGSFYSDLSVQESNQTKNGGVLSYLGWICPILAFEREKSFSNSCGEWLIFHSGSSFLQMQCRKPIALLSLILWQIFIRSPFFNTTSSDIWLQSRQALWRSHSWNTLILYLFVW